MKHVYALASVMLLGLSACTGMHGMQHDAPAKSTPHATKECPCGCGMKIPGDHSGCQMGQEKPATMSKPDAPKSCGCQKG